MKAGDETSWTVENRYRVWFCDCGARCSALVDVSMSLTCICGAVYECRGVSWSRCGECGSDKLSPGRVVRS